MEDRIGAKTGAESGESSREVGTPLNTGWMGASEDVAVIFIGGETQGACAGEAGSVFVN